MKFKHKKLLISGTAVAAAGVLGAGTLLQSVLSVQASSEMMPGIETIVSESTEEDPFRILELVDSSDDAEIGYYISVSIHGCGWEYAHSTFFYNKRCTE